MSTTARLIINPAVGVPSDTTRPVHIFFPFDGGLEPIFNLLSKTYQDLAAMDLPERAYLGKASMLAVYILANALRDSKVGNKVVEIDFNPTRPAMFAYILTPILPNPKNRNAGILPTWSVTTIMDGRPVEAFPVEIGLPTFEEALDILRNTIAKKGAT